MKGTAMTAPSTERMKRKGIGLLVIMSAVAVLALFTGAILLTTVRTLQAVTEGEQADQARYAAYSGIQSALSRLNTPNEAGWSHLLKTANPLAPNLPDDEDLIQVTFAGNPDVQAIVGVYNNSSFCPDAFKSATAPDGTEIPEGQIYICSTGIVRGKKKAEITTVGSLIGAQGYAFKNALFTNGPMEIASGLVDSFDSAVASGTVAPPLEYATGFDFYYSPYVQVGDSTTHKKKATIGTSSSANNAVVVGTTTGGSPTPGPGSTPTPPITGGTTAVVDGDVILPSGASGNTLEVASDASLLGQKQSGSQTIPATFLPTGAEPLPAVVGGTLTLIGGKTYHVPGDLVLDNVEVLVVPVTTGGTVTPVSIYVEDDVTVTNGSKLNWGKKPGNLQLYMLDSGAADFKMQGSKGSMLVAGGQAKVELDQAEIFGAVMAGAAKVKGDSKVHYDVKIAEMLQGRSDFTATSFFTGVSSSSETVQEISAGTAPPPPPAGTPTGGCGCGCGCLLAEQQCL